MSESPRQQTDWPWMRELQVLDDDAGLDDVALAVDQQRELAPRSAIYASALAFEWRSQAPAGPKSGHSATLVIEASEANEITAWLCGIGI